MEFKKRKISIYHSFEEAEKAEREFILNQAPAERIKQTVDLILRTYNTTREELARRKKNKSIQIISYY